MKAYRCLVLGAATMLGGCLMTSTVPDLGTVTEARPFILRDAVDPRPERILTAFPKEFFVPVAVNGPTSTFQWRVYVDLDRKAASAASGALFDIWQTSEAEPLSSDAIRRIRFSLDAPTQVGAGCTLVQFYAARSFDDRSFPGTSPTAGPPDSVSWLIATGPEGCADVLPDAGVSQDAGASADAAIGAAEDASDAAGPGDAR